MNNKRIINFQLFYRRTCLLIYDAASVMIASFFAIVLRYEFEVDMIPDYFLNTIIRFLPFNIILTIFLNIIYYAKRRIITTSNRKSPSMDR